MKRKTSISGKGMYCPVCGRGKIFAAADPKGASQIRLLGPQEAEQAACFAKCSSCGTQVGVAIRQPDSQTQQISIFDTVVS